MPYRPYVGPIGGGAFLCARNPCICRRLPAKVESRMLLRFVWCEVGDGVDEREAEGVGVGVQGFLAHEKTPTSQDHHKALSMVLL